MTGFMKTMSLRMTMKNLLSQILIISNKPVKSNCVPRLNSQPKKIQLIQKIKAATVAVAE